ncbi:MAG TPA: SRPBCC family protein [Acidimicrobiales bacterium]
MLPTRRPRVLGIPVGRRRTDWASLGRVGALGVGALTSVAGGVGAKRAGGRLKDKVVEQTEKGKRTMQKVGDVADQASSLTKSIGGPVGKVTSALGSMTGGGNGAEPGGDDGGQDAEENLKKLRLIIKEGIDVGVPLTTAYNQWTQFADMPRIMKGPQSVDHEADDETRWVAKIGPSRRRWTAKILEQVPDERIVWESTDGTENRGAVTFHRLDGTLTRVHVEMEYFPNGFVEKVGNVFLAARRRVRKDLRLYKHFLELNGEETGEWRGEIPADDESAGDEDRPQAKSA